MERLTLQQVAKELGISVLKLRQGIIDGVFPFAVVIKPADDASKYTFVILRSRFDKWKRGEFIG